MLINWLRGAVQLADSNLISGSSAFSKTSLNIWKFLFHVLLEPNLKDFEHYFASMWNECNCMVICTFFGIALFGDEESTHWKRPWFWERLKAEGQEYNRWWDAWKASLIQWTWTWANSRRCWGVGKPGMLQSMVSGRVRHDLATEQQLFILVFMHFLNI